MFETILSRGVEPARWLVVIGIAYTLSTAIWSFFDTPVSAVRPSPEATQETTAAASPANVNWILSKHLFGQAGAAPVVADSDAPAVQTRLPLELRSVFVADDPQLSAAIVAQKGKPGVLYTVDDTLPGNATLIEVRTDRIILRRAGNRETLMFPKSKSQFMASEVQQSPASAPRPANSAGRRIPVTDDANLNPQLDQTNVLQEYRDRLAADAAATLDELGIEPVDAQNGSGYRIGDIGQTPYLARTGLQPGDVILSVNGRAVGDIQADQLELDNIMAQGSARIEVQRGSRRFFITASLK